MKLSDIAYYVEENISSDSIELNQYITTDNLLQNKEGRTMAANLPPQTCSLTHYLPGDVLVANIRPYLKKVWKADIEGGCSKDVLVLRAREGHHSEFLYAVALQDVFFDNAMLGNKGTQMPRGNKDKIMELPVYEQTDKEIDIGELINKIQEKITLNTRMNAELEAMAKQLYYYWFVQFDFPDENGKPYKTSGGKMVWDEKLKREIPEGWEVKNVFDVSNVLYGFPFSTDCFVEDITKNPIVRIRDIIDNTTSAFTVEQVDETYRLKEGDLLIGMDGNFHMNYWHNDNCYINQRCVRFRDVEEKDVSSIQLYYNIKPVLEHKQKSIIGSTVGHLLDSDIKDFWVIYPSITYRKEIKQKFKSILYVITNSIKEKVYLTSVRDSLLPMLMNGQVTVE